MTPPASAADATVADIVKKQRALERKRWLVVLFFLAVSLVSLVFDIATGPSLCPWAKWSKPCSTWKAPTK